MHRAPRAGAFAALAGLLFSIPEFSQSSSNRPSGPGGGLHASACPAGDARDNTATPYEIDGDFVPLLRDDSLGCHVVYSGKSSGGGLTVAFNSAIYIFELDSDELLVFGAGYGDPFGPGSALNDAAFDVANVDAIVRDCLLRVPTQTVVHFVAPHGHGDHINSAFIHELENAGYTVADILFHEDDSGMINGMPGWTPADKAKFVKLNDDGGCGTELLAYASPVGKIWFVARPGHTPGSIDLVVDVRDNPNDRFLIQGSTAGGQCATAPEGTLDTTNVHGNVLLTTKAQSVFYGSGVNPAGSLALVSGSPRFGQSVTLGVSDPTGQIAAGAATLLFSSLAPDARYPAGTLLDLAGMSGSAEVLIGLSQNELVGDPLVGAPWGGLGQRSNFVISVPNDASLLSTPVYYQGLLVNSSGGAGARLRLTEALELRFGT